MNDLSFLNKFQLKNTEKLLEEAQPILTGTPRIWHKRIGEQVTKGEQVGQLLKAGIPLAKGQLRPDLVVIHELPTANGLLQVVFTYSANILLPVDQFFTLHGRIPRAVLLKKGLLSCHWVSKTGTDEDKSDDFCVFLSEIKKGKIDRFHYNADWKLELGNYKVNLDWTMQLVPLSEDRFIFQYHQPYETGLIQPFVKAKIRRFINLANWLQETIQNYSFEGDVTALAPITLTLSMFAIPEIAGEQRPESQPTPPPAPVAVATPPADPPAQTDSNNPLMIAKQRLAKGEISIEEYNQIKSVLES